MTSDYHGLCKPGQQVQGLVMKVKANLCWLGEAGGQLGTQFLH